MYKVVFSGLAAEMQVPVINSAEIFTMLIKIICNRKYIDIYIKDKY